MKQAINSNGGITLIELLLTVTILSIVIAVAAPPMSTFFKRYQAGVQRQKLFDLIALGRAKAYGHGKIYTLCPSTDGATCSTVWSDGVLAFIDADGSGTRSSDELIERIMEPLPGGSSLAWKSFGNKPFLQFRPNGLTENQSGNFTYCPPDGDTDYGWIIVLNASGRPYFGKDTNGNGVVENGSGQDLSCTTAI